MKAVSQNADYKFRVETCFVPGHYPLYAQDMGIVVVIDILRAERISLRELKESRQSLEELFLRAVQDARKEGGRA